MAFSHVAAVRSSSGRGSVRRTEHAVELTAGGSRSLHFANDVVADRLSECHGEIGLTEREGRGRAMMSITSSE